MKAMNPRPSFLEQMREISEISEALISKALNSESVGASEPIAHTRTRGTARRLMGIRIDPQSTREPSVLIMRFSAK